MNKARICLLSFLFAALLLSHETLAHQNAMFTHKQAVEIAKAELKRRRMPLPPRYNVFVTDSIEYREIASDRPIYIVAFRRIGASGRSARLYDVNVDRATRKILYVNDLQRTVPVK